MGIMRWSAEADTTITNAWKEGFSSRGETANMGLADALEVFSLYGQSSKTGADSKEVARILIRFNMTKLRESLAAGDVPLFNADNAPKYYLRLFNAPHPETLPRNFTLDVFALDQPFEEGTGIDMSEYKDVGAASWTARAMVANSAGTGTITVVDSPANGTTFNVKIDTELFVVTAGASEAATKANIIDEINNGTAAANTASALVDAASGAGNTITITSKANGASGNYRYDVAVNDGNITTANYYMTGGSDYTKWTDSGGTAMGTDSGPYTAPAKASQTFETGEEDILLDITAHVQNMVWDGSALRSLNTIKTNHKGYIIKIATENVSTSIYTKKFFARSSEYFFKRPCIEARWDASVKDNRGKFYAESSLLTNAQNKQNLFLYNSVNGSRSDYNANLWVRYYSDPDYTQLITVKDANHASAYTASPFGVVNKDSTGVYRSSVVVDTNGSKIYDKWYSAAAGGSAESSWTIVHTGSVDINQRTSELKTKKDRYIFTITNLKNSYSRSEKPRFRVYSRLKDWSPTIYTVARRSLQNEIVDNVYFKIFRVVDDEVLFDYGRGTTASNNDHTLLSYDSEGSYFDFDMSLLEAGYMYGIRIMTSIDGELREQKEIFKFRVD